MTSPQTDASFEALLEYLKTDRGTDFTGYKRATLLRRTRKRMEEVGVGGFDEYREHLETHPQEFAHLFNTVLINVTGFFRDPEAWEALARELRARLAAKRDGEPVRVWSAGCASGEEPYTLVILLAELLGMERFRQQVKVYATDMDDEALAQARSGSYTAQDVEDVPEELRERYFDPSGGRWALRADLRRYVIFGRHDLVHDAPISHLDLLVCRNTLMYFNAEVQERIMGRFHYALGDQGLLFLGRAEMGRAHGSLFAPVDLRARIFARVPRASLRDRVLAFGRPDGHGAPGQTARQLRLRDAALDADPAARALVDADGSLVMANAAARRLFGLTQADTGRPLQDLTFSYRPVELRSRIEQAFSDGKPVYVSGVEHPTAEGELRTFDVLVVPLPGDDGPLGASVVFTDTTEHHRLRAEVQQANQEMETAFEELQSTNEELETMNEELQSTNEELETLNDELHRRTAELDVADAYVASVLGSLRVGVAVLDPAANVHTWNPRAEDLWGVRADEVVGTAFQNLDIGLPVERLKAPVRACLEERSDAEEVVLDAVNRRGRAIRCRVTCVPLVDGSREVHGVVVLMEERAGTLDEA